jgi:hypothetical protein
MAVVAITGLEWRSPIFDGDLSGEARNPHGSIASRGSPDASYFRSYATTVFLKNVGT